MTHNFFYYFKEKSITKPATTLWEKRNAISSLQGFRFFKNKIMFFLIISFSSLSFSYSQEPLNTKEAIVAENISVARKETFLTILHDASIRSFIQDILTHYWKCSQLPTEWLPAILNIFADYDQEPEFAIQIAQETFPELTERKSSFYEHYRQARSGRLKNYSELLAEEVQGKIVADIGTGDAQFLEYLFQLNPEIEHGYATDILPVDIKLDNEKISIITQPSPCNTGLSEKSVDTAVVSGVLHHINSDERVKLILHIKEILKVGGRLVVVEDSFPETIAEKAIYNPLTLQFMHMNRLDQEKVLAFIDWWGNRFLKNNRDIPLPCTFKSMEEWIALIEEIGLKCVKTEFAGFPNIHAHVMVPKAVLIFERLKNPQPMGWQKQSPRLSANNPTPKIYIERLSTNAEALTTLPKSGWAINLSIGGTKIQATVAGSRGEIIYQSSEYCWREEIQKKAHLKSAQAKQQWIINKIVEHALFVHQQAVLKTKHPSKVESLSISWAGPVIEGKLVCGVNIAGFQPQELDLNHQNILGVDLYQTLKERIKTAIGSECAISILNDADAAAIAAFREKKIDQGVLIIIGTGIGSGIYENGKCIFNLFDQNERMGEIGHHIVYHPEEHCYFYDYDAFISGPKTSNPYSVTNRLSGPAIARRFVSQLIRENGEDLKKIRSYLLNQSEIEFSETDLVRIESLDALEPILEAKLLLLITAYGLKKDRLALAAISNMGYETGLALGVFLKEFDNHPFIKTILLDGGVARQFGRDVLNEDGEDLFLSQMHKGIQWVFAQAK